MMGLASQPHAACSSACSRACLVASASFAPRLWNARLRSAVSKRLQASINEGSVASASAADGEIDFVVASEVLIIAFGEQVDRGNGDQLRAWLGGRRDFHSHAINRRLGVSGFQKSETSRPR